MTETIYHVTQPGQPFARTNRQTIIHRANVLRDLGYDKPSIAEICCGDCQQQQRIYQAILGVETYCGLDINPTVVALNRANGIACVQGDALEITTMRQFSAFDALFFGPPLSVHCDGHTCGGYLTHPSDLSRLKHTIFLHLGYDANST